MMTVEEIRESLKDRRIGMVAQVTGLHYNTIKDIRDGVSVDPKHTTVRLLSGYLEGKK